MARVEKKTTLVLHNDRKFLWRSGGEVYEQVNTVTSNGHGGENIIELSSFAANCASYYLYILQLHLNSSMC